MPNGKVRFYDEDKGFGFIQGDDGQQVYLHASVIPDGAEVQAGTRLEYSVADGRKGPQALSVRIIDTPRLAKPRRNRKSADEMALIIEDLVKLLDDVGGRLKAGQYPERQASRQDHEGEALVGEVLAGEVLAGEVSAAQPDPELLNSRELARSALAEITDPETIGAEDGHEVHDSCTVTLFFECRLPGYPGWRWAAALAKVSDDAPVTVLEVELLPGAGAVLAPEWVPWSKRSDRQRVEGDCDGALSPAEADAIGVEMLIAQGLSTIQVTTSAYSELFGLERADWSVDLPAGQIKFTTPESVAVGQVQVIGTMNPDAGTWMWGWDHPSVPAAAAVAAGRVQGLRNPQ
ncbi:hypothetical protein FQR65_LT20944 [Abscondita terminalis]|nr:hypothetical protein FQR65_LT20944 [Abscondita terminalis]